MIEPIAKQKVENLLCRLRIKHNTNTFAFGIFKNFSKANFFMGIL